MMYLPRVATVTPARLGRASASGVDVRKHAGGGAELQQRDILAPRPPRWRAAALHPRRFVRPRLMNQRNQIDVMHGEVDDHADVRHSRRKGRSTRVIAIERMSSPDYRLLDGGHRGLGSAPTCPTIKVTRRGAHARRATCPAPLLDRGRDRLFFDQM